ncbi:MAG: thrombospondin type 3 repeat-containing protein, partial [Desulfuromonadales bacterium]|nr:thrombospondin type 3 repeat-containing protein [Desulfuromonadales bacterium]
TLRSIMRHFLHLVIETALYKTVDALGNGWGVTTGDIHAAVRSDSTDGGVWYVTSINGQQVDAQIQVSETISSTPATSSNPMTITQNVRTGFKWSGTSTGFYKGPLTQELTAVAFPSLAEGGFAYGTYSSDIGTGSGRAYRDGRDSVTAKRYLTFDGALFGHGVRQWPVASYSCYDLEATQRYEHVLAPGLSTDPAYQSTSDNLFVSGTGTQYENVDVTVFEGYSNTATATGAISGTRTMQLRKRVDIHSGTYAGWVYKIHTYELNGYRGTTYIIGDGISGRGYATGDINAVIDGSAARWHLTSIKGVPTTGVIDFGGTIINTGTRTDYSGLLLRISSGTHEVSYSGYKNGVNHFNSTAVVIPSLGDGFLYGNYDSPWGSGEAYVYIDNNHAPVMFRKGIAVGPLHGTRDVKGDLPNLFGSTVYEGLWEFVRTDTDGDGTVNSEDLDDDNDGLSDVVETIYNLNPLDPADAQDDPDGDGLTNLEEILLGYSISLADTDGDGVNDSIDNCPTISNADQSDVCSGSSEVSEIPSPPNPVVSAPPTVTVAPTPDVEITIEAVKTGGTVSVTPLNKPAPPANFKIVTGAAYEISTDVTYDGLITVCLDYQDSALAKAGNEDNLKLFHRSGANWDDITTTIDTANNQICGETATLSPFAVGEPVASTTTPSTSTGVPIMNGWWLLAAVGGGVALLRRRSKNY